MNLIELNDAVGHHVIHNDDMKSRISKILKACECSEDLMIGIYLIEKENFLYCNHKLKNIVSNNCTNLLEEGWNFWFSIIDPKEVIFVKKQVNDFFTALNLDTPLVLQYHIINRKGDRIFLKHEICMHQIERKKMAINYLFDITDMERVEQYFRMSKTIDVITNAGGQCPRISAREKEVLELIANGFSSKEIANRLFISNHTAISHRKNLIEKFQVKNTAHLVKKSVGYLNL